MRVRVSTHVTVFLFFLLSLGLTSGRAFAHGSVHGTVTDPLGAAVTGARVEVLHDSTVVKDTTTNAEGAFEVQSLEEGRYTVAVSAAGFARVEGDPFVLREGGRASSNVMLPIAGVRQDVVVTAAAGSVSVAQVGASITVLDAQTFAQLGSTQLLDPLRTVPGLVMVQNGQRGGVTSLFSRGGSANFNKVLIDGVPANDIGGAFDFADLSITGIERAEVLRGANSVIYGSDAMTSVVDITTRRGRTRTPEASVSADIGELSTTHADMSVGGTASALDYFASFGRLQTDNSVPNSKYGNSTFAARVGARVGATDISGTARWFGSNAGAPNAFNHFGIADDATSDGHATYATLAVNSQWSDRLQTTIRFGSVNADDTFNNPTPTGTPSDSSAFANYLGNTVTITSANGDSVTGMGILDYSGTYPSPYTSAATRRFLFGQAGYQVVPSLNVAGGVRIESEHGEAGAFLPGVGRCDDPVHKLTCRDRSNYGGFVEGRGAIGSRLFVNGGLGFDHNDVFGDATTPRVSVAAYLRAPSSTSALGDTKVTFNAGRGIKAPSVSQQASSVFDLIPSATAATLGIAAIGPERSRTVDIGVEQGLAKGKARVRVSYFDSEFTDIIEYLSKNVLPQLGVPVDAANATGFGAYANAQSNTSKGVELSANVVGRDVTIGVAYTHLDAEVTASLGSGALFPMVNDKFPGITIGQYSPLVGNRPFRRPANSGSVVVGYARGRINVSWAEYFFGRADDSTFLSDAFFGASMLLPNQDLDPAYQRADINASVKLHDRLRWFVSIENAFDKLYEATSGYPALPRVARSGVTLTLGGDR